MTRALLASAVVMNVAGWLCIAQGAHLLARPHRLDDRQPAVDAALGGPYSLQIFPCIHVTSRVVPCSTPHRGCREASLPKAAGAPTPAALIIYLPAETQYLIATSRRMAMISSCTAPEPAK